MDLCVLYGSSNKPLLAKLVANVLKVQPQYKQDWSMAVLSFAKVSLSLHTVMQLFPPCTCVQIFQKVSGEVLPARKAMLLTDKPKT